MNVRRRERADRFDDAFERLAVVARRVAFRILGNRADADDVAQEALARAYARWSSVAGHAEPWVARVATNLALGVWRKRRPVPTLAGESTVASLDRVSDERAELVAVVSKLPKRQREVVVLRFLADRSEQQTADALGCSVGTVKQHSHRALASLRRTLTADAHADARADDAAPRGAADVLPPR